MAHVRSASLTTASRATIALESGGSPVAEPQEQVKQEKVIEVRISLAKRVVAINETLSLHVELWNVGTNDISVCKNFRSDPCALRVDFQPLAKVEHWGWSDDCVSYERTKHAELPRAEDFAKILVKDWISIPPNHFYGTTIELTPSSYPELGVAGRYRVSVMYLSGGLLEGHCYYKLKPFSNEGANLPA